MDRFKFIVSGLWDFLGPFVKAFMTRGGLLLLRASQQAVLAVAMDMTDHKGTEKRDAAFEMIKDQLAKEGIEMATDLINGAIEAAVIRLNRT